MVTMLYRYAKLIGVDSDNRASLSGFTDSDEISSYAYDAMRWAVAEGFITGMGDGTVDPKGNSTRAQVATVLTKFVEMCIRDRLYADDLRAICLALNVSPELFIEVKQTAL